LDITGMEMVNNNTGMVGKTQKIEELQTKEFALYSSIMGIQERVLRRI
jgi:hypothetical protein